MKIEKILLILSLVFIMSIVFASFGIAYAGRVRGAGLLGACFFLTFGIIIVLAQLILSGDPRFLSGESDSFSLTEK